MGNEMLAGAVGEARPGETKRFGTGMRGWIRRRWRPITFIAYVVVIVCVMAFHEPWFDEAQSWLIARDASFRDILLLRPHYEGHPPLWWLMLAIPAKLGVPYEIGLKGVQLVCAAVMAWLLVFRSPFPPAGRGPAAVHIFSMLPIWRHLPSVRADVRRHIPSGRLLEGTRPASVALDVESAAALLHQ